MRFTIAGALSCVSMKRMVATSVGLALFMAEPLETLAQTYQDSGGTFVRGVVPILPGVGPLFTSANPGKISGSFSASLSGFQPTPAYATLSVAATSSRVALPSGTVVIVYNTGSNPAYVTFGDATVIATTSNDVVPAAGWMAFTVGTATTSRRSRPPARRRSICLAGLACRRARAVAAEAAVELKRLGRIDRLSCAGFCDVQWHAGQRRQYGRRLWLGLGLSADGPECPWRQRQRSVVCPARRRRHGREPRSDRCWRKRNQRPGGAGRHRRRANAGQCRQHRRKPDQHHPGRRFGGDQHLNRGHDAAGGGILRQIDLCHGVGRDRGWRGQLSLSNTAQARIAATGTTPLTGAYGLTAQFGIAKGNGLGPVLVVPAGNALCAVTSAAVQMSGSVCFTQF